MESAGPDRCGTIAPQVVAVNWRQKAILLGECKWGLVLSRACPEPRRRVEGMDTVGRDVIRDLIEKKTPRLLKDLPDSGKEWDVYYTFFARIGFTDAARAEAKAHDAWLVDLAKLDRDLRHYCAIGKQMVTR